MSYNRRTVLHGFAALPASAVLHKYGTLDRTNLVHDGAALQRALRDAQPGAVITMAPGNYGDVEQFELTAPDVTLYAARPLSAVLRAPLIVLGDGATVADIAFLGDGDDDLYLSAAGACRDSVMITGRSIEIRGCDFGFFTGRAVLVRPTATSPYIHDCTFHDNRKGGDRNAHEAIALGYDNPNSNKSMRARVVSNRLWNLNVETEAICVKTSDNVIQNNQISSSAAGYSNRCGERNQYIGNKSTNSRGFAIGDRSTKLVGNSIAGSGRFVVLGGSASASVTRVANHLQAEGTYLERNSGELVVGHNYPGTRLPALNTTVKGHSGRIKLANQKGTKIIK